MRLTQNHAPSVHGNREDMELGFGRVPHQLPRFEPTKSARLLPEIESSRQTTCVIKTKEISKSTTTVDGEIF